MKSSLTTLLQLSKGAIHLNTSVAAKGPDHIFFILSQHLYDMQLEMLLACKYANPTKAELQTQGLDGYEEPRLVREKMRLAVSSFADTSHVPEEDLWEERKDSRLYKWQAGGCLVMLDVARHHKVRNNPDLYTAIEEMLGGSVGTSKYAGCQFGYRQRGFHHRARSPRFILFSNDEMPPKLLCFPSPIGPDRPLCLILPTGSFKIDVHVKSYNRLKELRHAIAAFDAAEEAENDVLLRAMLEGGTGLQGDNLSPDSLPMIYADAMCGAFEAQGLGHMWDAAAPFFKPKPLPRLPGDPPVGGMKINALVHSLFKKVTFFESGVMPLPPWESSLESESAAMLEGFTDEEKRSYNDVLRGFADNSFAFSESELLDPSDPPTGMRQVDLFMGYNTLWPMLRQDKEWQKMFADAITTPDAQKMRINKVITDFGKAFGDDPLLSKVRRSGTSCFCFSKVGDAMMAGGTYCKGLVSDGTSFVPDVVRKSGVEMLDRHAAAVVCFFLVRYIKAQVPSGSTSVPPMPVRFGEPFQPPLAQPRCEELPPSVRAACFKVCDWGAA